MINPSTFCSAPWFQIRIEGNGQYQPCCEINTGASKFQGRTNYSTDNATVDEYMTSEYLQYLRKELDTTRPSECASCWKKEAVGLPSLRQSMNNSVTNNQGDKLNQTWVALHRKHTDSYKSYRILSADIKLSNICNFACAMCSPINSSKIFNRWINDQDVTFVKDVIDQHPNYFAEIISNNQNRREYDYFKRILEYPIKHLKILGGEPLLDKELFNILESVPTDKQKDIAVLIVTNGSQDLTRAAEKLKNFKSVSFGISLEGIGAIQDYIREGSVWNEIESNLIKARQNNIDILISHTIQAATVLKLPELLLWCQEHSMPICFNILSHPDYLSLSVLSTDIKTTAINQLKSIGNITVIISDDNQTKSVKSLCDIIETSGDNTINYNKFLDYFAWYDKDKAVKLHHICPELT